jgi:putative flippase GtrA
MALMNRDQLRAYLPLIYQLFRFGIVGIIAASIHFSIVVLLVQNNLLTPLLANIVGFAGGFQVSYWGHRLWTFNASATLHRVALPRLIVVQVISLLANETLFYIFLSLNLPYPVALLIVLTTLPIFTFISSKLWVFRTDQEE